MVRRTKPDDQAKQDGQDSGFLSRWSARKSQIAKGELVPDEPLATNTADEAITEEDDEDAALTDAELLEKYELPDPEEVTEESGLERFLNGEMPERLRQMALRRLWRLNPLFGIVDDMVEYGEDYTDAATVIEGMKTAYTAGKGYASKAVEPEKEAELGEQEAAEDAAGDEAAGDEAAGDEAAGDEAAGDKAAGDEAAAAPDETADHAKPGDETQDKADPAASVASGQATDESAQTAGNLPASQPEDQSILSEIGENIPDLAAVMPRMPENAAAGTPRSIGHDGESYDAKAAAEDEEKTDENQVAAWRPARMDFRKK